MSKVPVYVINLQWQPERREQSRSMVEDAGFSVTWVKAVDGRSLTSLPAEQLGQYDRAGSGTKFTHDLTPGEVAAYLSHLEAHRAFLASGAECGIVLEDDCRLVPEFASVVSRVLEADAEWDLVKLCGVGRWSFVPIADLVDGYQLVDYGKYPKCMYATLVRRSGSEKLLQRGLPFSRPIDIDLQHWWEREMRMLSVFPPVAHEAGLHDSAIRALAASAPRERPGLMGGIRRWYRQQRFRNSLMVRQIAANVRHFGLLRTVALSLSSFWGKLTRKGLPKPPPGTRY
ncbi:MAG: glycosyltransferase family 25 protein [Longimicrobiales bacterium]